MVETQVQHARGASANFNSYTGPAGEICVNTDDWSLRVQDGITVGGWPLRAGSIGTNFSFQQPASGATLTASAHLGTYVIDPAGALAALTIVLPSAPNNGDVFWVICTQAITTLTINPAAGQSVRGGGALSAGANAALAWLYRAANATWYRCVANGLS